MEQFKQLIDHAIGMGIADIHLKCGQPPIFRISGSLQKQKDQGVITVEVMNQIIDYILPERCSDRRDGIEEIDFAYATEKSGRFRVNLFLSGNEPTLVMRHVKSTIPNFSDINLPDNFANIAMARRGIIILAGATGSGKSTTLAAMIQHMNLNESRRIITIEDPIEYQYSDELSIISQREVGLDTPSFFNGLKAALRQDPDVILIGELRDHTSFEAALMAAETGHLILTTLHADTASMSVNRILDIFPSNEQDGILAALAGNLRAIICQRLVPDNTGGVRPAVEVMINTPIVQKLLEEGDIEKLSSAISNGREDGMCTFNQYLFDLIKANVITEDTGMRFATNPEALKMNLKGIFIESGQSILGG